MYRTTIKQLLARRIADGLPAPHNLMQLAAKAQLSYQTVASFASGKTATVSPSVVAKIAAALDVSPNEIVIFEGINQ